MARGSGPQLQGELQIEVMRAVWRLERATVDEVRRALPSRQRGAYTTVQTVLNRLTDRGLLRRQREGKRFHYKPRVSEADYYSRSLRQTLDQASTEARRSALASIVGELDPKELGEIEALADEIARQRR